MKKNIMVVTHERSGTHLMINLINYENNGDFISLGKLPKKETVFNLENYINYVIRHIRYSVYDPDIVYKSHHQIEFFEPIIDEVFNKFKIVYVKRSEYDILLSYYFFLNGKGWDNKGKSIPIPDFPDFKDWIFMKPNIVGMTYFEKYPDPHIFKEPDDYLERIIMHQSGWLKYENDILIVNYENLLSSYESEKQKIETFLDKKISDKIPSINDPNLPNFAPNKGVIGEGKKIMSEELIEKIEKRIKDLYIKWDYKK